MTIDHIALIGGSFDPIHNGHLQLARSAQAHCMADQVWFVPAGLPWQKGGTQATAEQRLAMLELAIEGVHSWHINPCELERTGPSYTVDTLQEIRQTLPHTRITLVLGADQIQRLPTWHQWQHLFDFAQIGMVERGGIGELELPPELVPFHKKNLLVRIPMPVMEVSSTELRRLIGLMQSTSVNRDISDTARRTLGAKLPKKVLAYIEANGLYSGKIATP